ncbi:hypothetical protein IYQ_22815, partial [Aeromonas salmonicida subsp. salmonicida 01-B526]
AALQYHINWAKDLEHQQHKSYILTLGQMGPQTALNLIMNLKRKVQ